MKFRKAIRGCLEIKRSTLSVKRSTLILVKVSVKKISPNVSFEISLHFTLLKKIEVEICFNER